MKRNFLLAAALIAALMAAPAAAQTAGPALSPLAPGVAAGQSLDFNGSGFEPSERVSLWVTTPDQVVLGGLYAGAEEDGTFVYNYVLPGDAIAGRWALTAYGERTRTPAIAFFEVQGRPPSESRFLAAVAPASGTPGTTFAFAAAGFDEEEKISYWFTAPDGSIPAAFSQEIRSNEDGRVDISWTTPADGLRGVWVVTIQGIKSQRARAITFELR